MRAQELKYILNLEDFDKVYIQKVLSTALNIFVITYNSRFPNMFLSSKRLRSTPTSTTYVVRGSEIKLSKLSPPVLLDNFQRIIPTNSIIYVRDIGGDGVLNQRDIIPSPADTTVFATLGIPTPMDLDLVQTIM